MPKKPNREEILETAAEQFRQIVLEQTEASTEQGNAINHINDALSWARRSVIKG